MTTMIDRVIGTMIGTLLALGIFKGTSKTHTYIKRRKLRLGQKPTVKIERKGCRSCTFESNGRGQVGWSTATGRVVDLVERNGQYYFADWPSNLTGAALDNNGSPIHCCPNCGRRLDDDRQRTM